MEPRKWPWLAGEPGVLCRVLRWPTLAMTVFAVCAALAAAVSSPGQVRAQDPDFVDLFVQIKPSDVSAFGNKWFTVTVTNQGELTAYDVDVVIKQAGGGIGAARVFEISAGEYTPDGTSGNWRIPRIESYARHSLELAFTTTTTAGSVGLKQYTAQVSSSAFEPESRMRDNRATAWQNYEGGRVEPGYGGYALAVTADDLFPSHGETVNFTFDVSPFHILAFDHGWIAACVNIGLTSGLTAGVPSFDPMNSGMSYGSSGDCGDSDFDVSGIFNVGDVPNISSKTKSMTLPVTVRSGVTVNQQCLTAEIFALPPAGLGDQDDYPNDNFARLCLGVAPDELVVLESGETDLFTWYDCAEENAGPCDDRVSLELVVLGGTAGRPALHTRFFNRRTWWCTSTTRTAELPVRMPARTRWSGPPGLRSRGTLTVMRRRTVSSSAITKNSST